MEFDLITFVAQIFNFLILLWILKKFLYAPILNAMKERKENIIKSLEDVEAKQEEAEMLRVKNEKVLEEIRKEKITLLKKAEAEVEQEKVEMLQGLQKEQVIARAEFEEQIQIEKKRFANEINKVVANKFADFSQNVFSELSDTNIETQVINIFLQKIKKLNKAEITKINTSAKMSNGEVVISTANSLSKEVEKKIKEDLKGIGITCESIKFQKDSEIILGINLQSGGYLISWDLKEFLNSFKEELTKILK